MNQNKHKLLIKFPSRSRPERFFKSLDSLYNNIGDKENFYVSCTLDEDDPTMHNDNTIANILSYGNISIEWGLSESKVHAINRDMPEYGDIIIVHSDDMIFTCPSFDEYIRADFNDYFPELDGILHYPDGDVKEELNTMYIAGRKFYEHFGFVYNPVYKSLWCDNELLQIAKKLGKHQYINFPLYLHKNAAYGHMEKDEMFKEQQAYGWSEDHKTFLEREQHNFYL